MVKNLRKTKKVQHLEISNTISYFVKRPGKVLLTVKNVLMEQIAELVNEFKDTGYYTVNFNISELATGIYYYHLQTRESVEIRKIYHVREDSEG